MKKKERLDTSEGYKSVSEKHGSAIDMPVPEIWWNMEEWAIGRQIDDCKSQ